jgi:hypothetical protein
MNEKASALVMKLAQDLMEFCDDMYTDPEWNQAFYRFVLYGKNHCGSNGCYVAGSKIDFLDDDMDDEFSRKMFKNGPKLFELLGKEKGLFLLAVDANAAYNIKFEFENLNRWNITKENDASGLPLDD